MNEKLAEAIVKASVTKLESLRETVERCGKESVEVVVKAKEQLQSVKEAFAVGSSQTFLGASHMLVGTSEGALGAPHQGWSSYNKVDIGGFTIELHGDQEALKQMKGRYKAIVLLFKAD